MQTYKKSGEIPTPRWMDASEKIIKAIIIICGTICLLSSVCRAQDRKIVRQGDDFRQVTVPKDTVKTQYTFTDAKGKKSVIYLNHKGRAFVGKVSKKTGKYYRYYLPKEIEETIIKENH